MVFNSKKNSIIETYTNDYIDYPFCTYVRTYPYYVCRTHVHSLFELFESEPPDRIPKNTGPLRYISTHPFL